MTAGDVYGCHIDRRWTLVAVDVSSCLRLTTFPWIAIFCALVKVGHRGDSWEIWKAAGKQLFFSLHRSLLTHWYVATLGPVAALCFLRILLYIRSLLYQVSAFSSIQKAFRMHKQQNPSSQMPSLWRFILRAGWGMHRLFLSLHLISACPGQATWLVGGWLSITLPCCHGSLAYWHTCYNL
jgi:hypothetical protein